MGNLEGEIQIRKEKIVLLVLCIFTMLLFWLGNLMNPKPGSSSGNGNPAILIMWTLVPLFCYLVYLWFRVIRSYTIKKMIISLGSLLILVHLIVAYLYQRSAFLKYREILAEAYKANFGFIDWEYIDQITTFSSIHVNNQYFNPNTYLMFLTASILIALVIIYFSQEWRKQK
ncbi:hypothetical protein [Robertmurraya kyonggiensis]|uniref:Uncharacterized protein n=1 Tax=Robertmurraya kyonggiensis TaxID=1037680 RepID=A0A4U1DA23_9BACI|nr:hypothetical protein [Robertmurraya kyonggiensis]TKC18873.1 hypothetical protein FA727_04785 [Robertmurraya kyonggiensis]